MNRRAAFTLALAGLLTIIGAGLYSPRLAVLVAAAVLTMVGVGQLDLDELSGRRQ